MGLKDDLRDKYYNIILYHVYKMRRLDDKDKGYSAEKIKSELRRLRNNQDEEVKAILTEEQYERYTKKFDEIIKGVYERNGWN